MERRRERKRRERERENTNEHGIFRSLIHSPDGHNSRAGPSKASSQELGSPSWVQGPEDLSHPPSAAFSDRKQRWVGGRAASLHAHMGCMRCR